jgi:hypothetical protein
LLLAEESFSVVTPSLLDSIDNLAMLLLDIVWCAAPQSLGRTGRGVGCEMYRASGGHKHIMLTYRSKCIIEIKMLQVLGGGGDVGGRLCFLAFHS